MAKFNDAEIIAAADNWKAWGSSFGWTLVGMGDPYNDELAIAYFSHEADGPNGRQFCITAVIRHDIDDAIAAAN